MLRKMRPVLIAVAVAVVVGSIVGARALTNGGSGDANAKPADTAPRSAAGLVVMGNVDTDPSPVHYGLPSVLASGMIAKVHVKEGDAVKIDQPLYEFDATMQKADLRRAELSVEYARTKVAEAKELAAQHERLVEVTEAGVDAAKRKESQTAAYYRLVEKNLEEYYKAEKYPQDTWAERKKNDPNLYKANVDYDAAQGERKLKEADLKRLKAVDPQVKVKEAEAAVDQAKGEQAKAQSAVDLCVVRAKSAGTVEHLTISAGTTLGVGTRTPALWLIPAGKRVVRAEVEAEFAHRVSPETHEGRAVTISDHTDPKLTYAGAVRRVPDTFMLKRNNADSFLGSDTRVIEVLVDVTEEPNPQDKKKPPLRVGQRVRVNLGQ